MKHLLLATIAAVFEEEVGGFSLFVFDGQI